MYNFDYTLVHSRLALEIIYLVLVAQYTLFVASNIARQEGRDSEKERKREEEGVCV